MQNMSTIIQTLIVYLSFFSCSKIEDNKVSCYVKLSNDNIFYELINNTNKDYFIPLKYEYNVVQDDLICEAHFKSDITEYNQFGVPKFQILKSNSKFKGNFKLQKRISNKIILFRIYTRNLEQYAKEKKLKTLTELDFLEYEKANSILIKAILN